MRFSLNKQLFCLGCFASFNLVISACAPAVKLGLNTGLDLSKIVVLKKTEQAVQVIDWPVLPSVGSGLLGLRALKKNKTMPAAEHALSQLARVPGFYELPRVSQDLQIAYSAGDEQLLARKKVVQKRVRNL